jgi:hypothetical protein
MREWSTESSEAKQQRKGELRKSHQACKEQVPDDIERGILNRSGTRVATCSGADCALHKGDPALGSTTFLFIMEWMMMTIFQPKGEKHLNFLSWHQGASWASNSLGKKRRHMARRI